LNISLAIFASSHSINWIILPFYFFLLPPFPKNSSIGTGSGIGGIPISLIDEFWKEGSFNTVFLEGPLDDVFPVVLSIDDS